MLPAATRLVIEEEAFEAAPESGERPGALMRVAGGFAEVALALIATVTFGMGWAALELGGFESEAVQSLYAPAAPEERFTSSPGGGSEAAHPPDTWTAVWTIEDDATPAASSRR